MSNNDQATCPQLERGQIIPAFTLPGPDGMPHSPWDYKQREHLLLLFIQNATNSEGRSLLRAFARDYAVLRAEECSLMTITADSMISNVEAHTTLRLPFPLLPDVQGGVISRYTRWESTTHTLAPCIVLADRYGALYEHWIVESAVELPPIPELVEILQYLNRLCTP